MGKRFGIALAIAAVVVAAGTLLYRLMFDGGDGSRAAAIDAGPPSRGVDAAPALEQIRVVSIEGVVDREVGGQWVRVAPGDQLSASDSIRTQVDGRAVLDVAGVQVELDQVSRLSNIVATRVELAEGRVSARLPSTGRRFGVAVEGSDAVAEAAGGEFAVLTDGEGAATVASVSGQVRVTARKTSVDLPAGTQSVVESGQAPTAPTPIPPSLFLKVQRPQRKVQRSRQLALSGETVPGAVLSINGRRVEVDAEGRFTAVVELAEGDNRVVVQTRDVAGRAESEDVGVVVDSKAPDVGGSVRWGKPP